MARNQFSANSTLAVALQQSALVGGDEGTRFNDSEEVGHYPAGLTINVEHPILEIVVFWDDEWIVGLKIIYNVLDHAKVTVIHGITTSKYQETVTLNPEENIIAVTGRAGDKSSGLVREPEGRVFELSFYIFDGSNANTRIARPYGINKATPFSVTANGRLVAFGGFAYPNIIEGSNIQSRHDEGLYGLTFIDIAYRFV